MRTRGSGLKKEVFYPICTHTYDPDCRTCGLGWWTNVAAERLGTFLYYVCRPLWARWITQGWTYMGLRDET